MTRPSPAGGARHGPSGAVGGGAGPVVEWGYNRGAPAREPRVVIARGIQS
jgi:hypothetical protein